MLQHVDHVCAADTFRIVDSGIVVAGGAQSGGARIIYVDNVARCGQVWLLLPYNKQVADDISEAGRRALAARVREVKGSPCLANPDASPPA